MTTPRASAWRPARLVFWCVLLSTCPHAWSQISTTWGPPDPSPWGDGFRSIARADVDGDGVADLVIGQVGFEPGLPGRIVIISGATGAVVRTIPEVSPTPIPMSGGSGFASRLIVTPDLDADGTRDVVVSNLAMQSCRVDAYSGGTGAQIWSRLTPLPSLSFGYSLASGPDLDLDGAPEILIGAPQQCSGSFVCVAQPSLPGSVFVVSGRNGFTLRQFANPGLIQLNASFGSSVVAPGDLDADGTADVVVASSHQSMATQIVAFSATSSAYLGVLGTSTGSTSIVALVSPGDLNADGVGDVILNHQPAFAQVGAAKTIAFSGQGSGTLWTYNGAAGGGPFEATTDQNNDGVQEILMARPSFAGQTSQDHVMISGADGTVLQSFAILGPDLTTSIIPWADLDLDSIDDLCTLRSLGSSNYSIQFRSATTGSLLARLGADNTLDSFGIAIEPMDDRDGDGVTDFWVGAPHADGGSIKDSGKVSLVSGRTGQTLGSVSGTAEGGLAGFALASTGDVNGDGFSEIAVGAPNQPGPLTHSGAILIFSGSTGDLLSTLSPAANLRNFGFDLEACGDLTGDGVPELAVATSEMLGNIPSGRVQIYDLSSGALLRTLASSAHAGVHVYSMANIGDLNQDSIPDLIIGAPGPWYFQLVVGSITNIVTGTIPASSTQGHLVAYSGSNGAVLWTVPSASTFNDIARGFSIAALNDVNADGIPDFVAGAPMTQNQTQTDTLGMFEIRSGADGSLLRRVLGTTGDEELGFRVANAGDLDADGVDDVATLSPLLRTLSSTSPSSIVTTPAIQIFSSATGERLWSMIGPQWAPSFNAQGFGYAMVGGRDLNADGLPDLVVSSPRAAIGTGAPRRGRVDVISPVDRPGLAPYGSSCPFTIGPQTFTPAIQSFGGVPSASTGNPAFGLEVTGAPPSALAILVLSSSNTQWNGSSLPFSLGSSGFPGCDLWVALEGFIVTATEPAGSPNSGRARISTPIPPRLPLVGQQLFAQWAIASPNASFPGGQVTGGLAITFL